MEEVSLLPILVNKFCGAYTCPFVLFDMFSRRLEFGLLLIWLGQKAKLSRIELGYFVASVATSIIERLLKHVLLEDVMIVHRDKPHRRRHAGTKPKCSAILIVEQTGVVIHGNVWLWVVRPRGLLLIDVNIDVKDPVRHVVLLLEDRRHWRLLGELLDSIDTLADRHRTLRKLFDGLLEVPTSYKIKSRIISRSILILLLIL